MGKRSTSASNRSLVPRCLVDRLYAIRTWSFYLAMQTKASTRTNARKHTKQFSNRFVAVVCGLLLSQVSLAQAPETQIESPVSKLTQSFLERLSFNINAFQVLGDNPLTDSVTQSLIAPYLGEDRGIDDIEIAADVLKQALTDKGFNFHQVSFPLQELTDGVVDLQINRYTIGEILVKGNNFYSDNNIIASMPRLISGSSPSTKVIARTIQLANQSSAKRVRLTLQSGEVVNEINASVTVVDKKPLVISAWINNTGSDISGDFRVGTSAAHANLFGLDHSGSLTFITSPEGINDVQQIAASYRIPFYKIGGSVSLLAVQSGVETGIVADVFDVAGRGEIYGIGYSHTLPNIGSYTQGFSLQLTDKLFDNDISFQGVQLLDDVRSRALALSYNGSWKNNKGLRLGASIVGSSNVDGGAFNNADSYLAARAGADNNWRKFNLGVNLQYTSGEWLYTAAAKYGSSSDRLITGEQFSVGGTSSLRGLEERELGGDKGYQLNLQAWAPEIITGLRPIAFIDAGQVHNNQPLEGEIDSESVVSVGVLLNWNPISKVNASASYGYLIDGIDSADELSDASRDGDSKLHFNLTYRF
jgi:hemolysin activation/secretion protein